jgi:hypothetical protein
MESRIQDALKYIQENPGVKVGTVAREFGVPYGRLRYRLEGRLAKKGQPAKNTKLSRPEEKALCRYIDCLDRINLAVRVEFVTSAANYILQERASRSERSLVPLVGPNWTTRFLKRHGYTKECRESFNQIANRLKTLNNL